MPDTCPIALTFITISTESVVPEQTDYYMLVASLPRMPMTFEVEQIPISAHRLRQRLRLLCSRDAAIVEQVQKFLHWDHQPADRTDREVEQEYTRLMQEVTSPMARKIVAYRMEVRTITSALRRRRLKLPPSAGVGPWNAHIQTHWQTADFKLSHAHPWIPSVLRYLEAGNPLQVERQLLLATWKQWSRWADEYHFCFESILLYLARWEIVDRWTRLNAELGRQRFDTLLDEALGEYVNARP